MILDVLYALQVFMIVVIANYVKMDIIIIIIDVIAMLKVVLFVKIIINVLYVMMDIY
jgi:hypothetical protein